MKIILAAHYFEIFKFHCQAKFYKNIISAISMKNWLLQDST